VNTAFFADDLLKHGKKVAYISNSGQQKSYIDLVSDAEIFSRELDSRQIAICFSKNSPEFLTAFVSLLRKRIVPILLPDNYEISQALSLIESFKATYLLIPDPGANIPPNFDPVTKIGEYVLFARPSSENLLDKDLALLLTTSGTTSHAKLVKISYSNLQSNAQSIVKFMNLDSSSRAITTLPFNYSYGLSIVNTHLLVGGSIVLNSNSITDIAFWDAFESFAPTHIGGVPFSYEVFKRFEKRLFSSPTIQIMTQAGGKLPEDDVKFFAEKCKDKSINFFVMYGQTEATARISYLNGDSAILKPGSIGRPIPDGRIYLKDSDGNIITDPFKEGLLMYEGPNVFLGYAEVLSDLHSSESDNKALSTGDVAYVDSEGDFFITGRQNRLAKINGIRINLQEIDDYLSGKGILGASVTDDKKLYIFIEAPEVDLHLLQDISNFTKVRSTLLKILNVTSLPRNFSGKISYKELKKWI